uniref:FCH domain-containing protein n=1 Tax=Zonotrichia albicollis TaxID=44394 RepID=A0A8D2M1E1_ZONAL
MKHGQISTKELADFVRERAAIEENYAKAMVKLSKMATNGTQLGTFAPLWEVFRISSDKLALCHLELMKKLHDLIKEISRYGEEQGRVHKKVAPSPPRHCPLPGVPCQPCPRCRVPTVQGGGGRDAGGRAAAARGGPAAAQVQGELPQQVPGVRAAAQGGHQPEGDRQGATPSVPPSVSPCPPLLLLVVLVPSLLVPVLSWCFFFLLPAVPVTSLGVRVPSLAILDPPSMVFL